MKSKTVDYSHAILSTKYANSNQDPDPLCEVLFLCQNLAVKTVSTIVTQGIVMKRHAMLIVSYPNREETIFVRIRTTNLVHVVASHVYVFLHLANGSDLGLVWVCQSSLLEVGMKMRIQTD